MRVTTGGTAEEDARPGRVRRPGGDGPLHRLLVVARRASSIAYQEADADGVEVWYVADPIHPDQAAQPTFYPRPGKANVKVRLGVVPVAGGETIWIDWDREKYPYLASVHWHKKGGLTLAVQTRLQQELVLLRADPATGKTTTLLTEHDPAWVNLHHDHPHWLADGSFLWAGEGKEGRQLEHRDKNGQLLKVLVSRGGGISRHRTR